MIQIPRPLNERSGDTKQTTVRLALRDKRISVRTPRECFYSYFKIISIPSTKNAIAGIRHNNA